MPAPGTQAGVADLVDLRLGDFRRPPVDAHVTLVTCPYRAFGHLDDDDARRDALTAVHDLLVPDGRFVFDVFTPLDPAVDIRGGDWVERAAGVWERDRWDREGDRMTVSVRSGTDRVDLRFALAPRERWRGLLEETGFEVFACYGWFDRSPCAAGGTAIWVARRAA